MIRKMVYSGIGMLFLSAVLVLAFQPKRGFNDPSDFMKWATANNLTVHSPSGNYSTLRVTDNPRSGWWDSECNSLRIETWSGVVTATEIKNEFTPVPNIPYRIWGRMCFQGDPELLNRMDRLR